MEFDHYRRINVTLTAIYVKEALEGRRFCPLGSIWREFSCPNTLQTFSYPVRLHMGQIPMKARTKVHNLGPFSELDIAPSFIYWYFSSLQLWSLEITGTLFYINWHFFPGIPVPQYKIVGNCLLRQKWAIILNKLDSLVVYISDCQSGGPSSNLCWDFFLFFPFSFFSPCTIVRDCITHFLSAHGPCKL